jgi:MFS family permease
MLLSLAMMGVGIGPLLVTLYSFGARRSPEGRSATVMTMLGSGLMVGQSLAAAITGVVSTDLGTRAALVLPLVSAALAVLAGAANWVLTPAGREPGITTGPIDLD